MLVVPADNAVMAPLAEPTEATDGELLLHVPPPLALVSVVASPIHMADGPEMAAGAGFTVTPTVPVEPE